MRKDYIQPEMEDIQTQAMMMLAASSETIMTNAYPDQGADAEDALIKNSFEFEWE